MITDGFFITFYEIRKYSYGESGHQKIYLVDSASKGFLVFESNYGILEKNYKSFKNKSKAKDYVEETYAGLELGSEITV